MASSSRFAEALGTNDVPSKEEMDEIQAMIRDPEDEIRRIDEVISRLQARRAIRQQFVDECRKLVSPSRRLPRELWGEVFVHCLPEKHLPVRSTTEAPLLLTTVCRSWREIALSTPRLWNSIHLFLPTSTEYRHSAFSFMLKGRQEGLSLWLERSGSLPLQISLAMNPLPATADARVLQYNCSGLVKVIASYCRRLMTLSLCHIHPQILDPLRHLSAEDLPLLRRFYEFGSPVDGSLYAVGHSQTPLLQVIGKSISLRELRVCIVGGNSLLDPSVRWNHLRALQVAITERAVDGLDVFRTLVEACPQLSGLTLFFSQMENGQHWSSVGAIHPRPWSHLQRLNLAIRGHFSVAFESAVLNMFETITTPALRHLSLYLSPSNVLRDRNSSLPFRNLITRSHCALSSLELNMHLGTGFHISLDNSTSLTTLSLCSPTWDPRTYPSNPSFETHFKAVVETLTPSNNSTWYPNVERLVLRSCPPGQALALINLLEARARATRLKSFTADFGWVSPTQAKVLASALALAESRDLGIKIAWHYNVVADPVYLDDPHLYSTGGRGFPSFDV
ncbi:hypothetical protein AAF712_012936 [Marasmius tenuissimus]|uniref:F-box domain-containing protein n=1 Tax=Marasmius tenuissimus TaxID=585030 RepID=A0ABR2ZHS1_9AGAR